MRFASFPQLALLLKGEAPQVDSCATLFEIDKSVNNERIGEFIEPNAVGWSTVVIPITYFKFGRFPRDVYNLLFLRNTR